jgi:hypothetical protein
LKTPLGLVHLSSFFSRPKKAIASADILSVMAARKMKRKKLLFGRTGREEIFGFPVLCSCTFLLERKVPKVQGDSMRYIHQGGRVILMNRHL